LAVHVNHNMPLHTVSRLTAILNSSFVEKKFLVCGVSYRQDVGDTRYSPVETLVRELLKCGADVACHDPYVTHWDEMNMALLSSLSHIEKFDIVIFAVPHKQYCEMDLSILCGKTSLVLDANSVFNKEQRQLIRSYGIRLESIGRGDGL